MENQLQWLETRKIWMKNQNFGAEVSPASIICQMIMNCIKSEAYKVNSNLRFISSKHSMH